MTKDFAIKVANQYSNQYNCTYYVYHDPEYYGEIFRNEGYRVTSSINESNLCSVVYVTK